MHFQCSVLVVLARLQLEYAEETSAGQRVAPSERFCVLLRLGSVVNSSCKSSACVAVVTL